MLLSMREGFCGISGHRCLNLCHWPRRLFGTVVTRLFIGNRRSPDGEERMSQSMLTVALASFYFEALCAWVLAVLLLVRYRASRFHRNVAGALLAIGLVQFAEGLSLLDSQNVLLWSRLALAGQFWLASA